MAREQKISERRKVSAVGGQEDKPKPHDITSEKAVLGAMLTDHFCINAAIEKFGVTPVFYSHKHQNIYKAICELYAKDRAADHISVAKTLSDVGLLDDIGGESYLAEMENLITTTANFDTWCGIIHDTAVLRRMIDACTIATEKCFESDREIAEILDEVERSIMEARDLGNKKSVFALKSLMTEAVEYLEKLSNKDDSTVGIPTGFSDLDDKITGLRSGEMIVIAARPSVGKTSMALTLVRNVALNERHPKSVVVFTMEMTAEQIVRRMLCSESKVPERSFRENITTREEWEKVTSAATRLKNAKIFIDPTPGLRVMELRAKARRLRAQEKIDLIVIDYLQLMHADVDRRNDTRQIEVSLISSGIKSLAKELGIPIIVLAQLNRAVEQQKGTPKLSNLRESGAIEQDADIVAFIHRDLEKQKEASEDEKRSGLEAELIVEKNRNGETGKIDLYFFPKIALFGARTRMNDRDIPDRQ